MRQTHLAGETLFVDFAGRTGVVDGRAELDRADIARRFSAY